VARVVQHTKENIRECEVKKLLIIPLILLLNGCIIFDSYFMAKYDTTEYSLVNQIKTKAQIAEENCSNQILVITQVNDLFITSLEFKNFTLHIPRNDDASKLSDKLFILTKDTRDYFNKTDKISTIFCKAKLHQIVTSADTVQRALGSKPK